MDHEVAILLVSEFLSFGGILAWAFQGIQLSVARCTARQFETEYQSTYFI
jgi:hypothetical protein